jgi:uncharacterized membrane protein
MATEDEDRDLASRAPWDPSAKKWRRGAGLEFDRVGAFNDAVFAIALTLLVLDLALPTLTDADSASDFLHALDEIVPDLIAYAVAFLIVGQYWIYQHGFYGLLGAINKRHLSIDIVYLLFVALIPFPTRLIAEYPDNPMALVAFVFALSIVRVMGAILFVYAVKDDLMRRPMSRDEFRFTLLHSLSPVAIYVASIPLAFVIGPIWAIVLWVPVSNVVQRLLDRAEPGRGSSGG